MKKSNYSI